MHRYLRASALLSIGLLASPVGTAQPVGRSAPSYGHRHPARARRHDGPSTREAANERLLKVFPKGFALGKTHQPHISTLQRYVKTADLDKVYEAVGKVLAEEKPTGWKLKAYKYYYIPWKEIGLAGIVIEPTDDLLRYQQKLIDAVTPFTVATGTAAAYVTTKEDPDINQPTIDYVATLCAERNRQEVQPSRHHRARPPGLPEEDARREV